MMKKLLAFLVLMLLCIAAVCSAGAENADERRVTLSGNAADTFVAEEDCYTEGQDVVLFFQKGMTVRGDMLAYVEEIMADLCQATGLTFAQNFPSEDSSYVFDSYYTPGAFSHIDPQREKIYVLAANLTGFSPWASSNIAVVDLPDMDRESPFALYHELCHVIYLRNAVDMGLMLDEGLVTYTVDKIYRAKGLVDWTTDFYMTSEDFDASCITRGAEGFSHCFTKNDDNYCYGFRFVTFLCETYGEDIIIRLLKAATDDQFDASFSMDEEADNPADTEHMKRIIISVTQEDVFDRFAQWHQEAIPRLTADFKAYAAQHFQE